MWKHLRGYTFMPRGRGRNAETSFGILLCPKAVGDKEEMR